MPGEQLVVPAPRVNARPAADFTAWVADHHRPLLNFAQLVAGDAATGRSHVNRHNVGNGASAAVPPTGCGGLAVLRRPQRDGDCRSHGLLCRCSEDSHVKGPGEAEGSASGRRRVMTDLFERRLAERLQAHPLPEEVSDLGTRSVRLGERMRRRRIGAVVVVLAVLLMVPAAAGLWRFAAGTGEPPVSSPSSRPPQTSTGAKVVILDLGHITQGAPPGVSTVRGGSLSLPSEATVKLPDEQFGSIAEYGSGFAWLTRAGGEFRLNMSSKPLPIAMNGSEVTGAEPGPRHDSCRTADGVRRGRPAQPPGGQSSCGPAEDRDSRRRLLLHGLRRGR